MSILFPYRLDYRGRTAEGDIAAYIRGLLEQVLFTSPGERINRPDFGSDLQQLVFASNNDALSAAVQSLVHAALLRFLGDKIQVSGVVVTPRNTELAVEIHYFILQEQRATTTTFTKELPS